MVVRARPLQARLLPHGWLDALRQVSLFGLAYLAYRLARGVAEGEANAAFAHARDLISLERGMHLFVEPSVQAWASGSHVVIVLASWLYVNAQGPITIAALLYLYMRHNSSFYFVRNMFMIAMAIALVGYIVFPTAPPRFMPEWGFTDTVEQITPVHVSEHSAAMNALFNPYAGAADEDLDRARPVGAVSVPDDVRDRRHRQPLHRRRPARRDHRRRVGVGRELDGAGASRRLALLGRARAPDRERLARRVRRCRRGSTHPAAAAQRTARRAPAVLRSATGSAASSSATA